VGGIAFALIAAVALGTAIGSAGGPYDGWGCAHERIGHSIFESAEGGGFASQGETLAAHAPMPAADGARTESEYREAVASRTGPDRFEPDTGLLHIDDKIEAQISLVRLNDGTWTIDNETLCHGPVPSELASPYPTPSPDET
jgi:hypothetical protein